MSRLRKQGLSYFPLDTDFLNQTEIKILLMQFGPMGVCLYIFLLCDIYRVEGYYLAVDKMKRKFTCLELGISEEEYEEVVDCCADIGLFNERLWKERRVLTSRDIQETYQWVKNSLRRKTPLPVDEDIWLISPQKTMSFIVFEDE